MPLQGNIDAARQCGDAAHATAVGLSLDQGAAAPVPVMGITDMNLFATAFGEFAAVLLLGELGEGAIPGCCGWSAWQWWQGWQGQRRAGWRW
jgi:hypothetical protein